MNTEKILSIIIVVSTLLTITISNAESQFFPSDRWTRAFQQHLNSVALKNGAAFVGSCYGPEKNEMAILIMPVGAVTGTLTLISAQKVYNGASVKIKNGKLVIIEGGGGEWSLRKLQFFTDKIAASSFQLKFSSELRDLLSIEPSNLCPVFP